MALLTFVKGVLNRFLNRGGTVGEGEQLPLQEVSNGVLQMVTDSTVQNLVTGQLFSLGTSEETVFQLLDDGRLQITTPIAPNGLNTYRGVPEGYRRNQPLQVGWRVSQTAISISTDVRLPDGTSVPISLDYVHVTPVGGRIVAHTTPDGTIDLQRWRGPQRTTEELQAVTDPSWRFATADEAASYALKWHIINNYADLIDQIKAQGGLGDSQIPQGDGSAAVNLLIELITGTGQAYVQHIVQT